MSKIIKNEAKSCLKVLFALLRLTPDSKVDLSELFQTKHVDMCKYLVSYPVPIEGYYWIVPGQRNWDKKNVPSGTLILARFDRNKRTVDLNFDYKNKENVVTLSDQAFNEASARMHRLPSPPFRGPLGETVREIKKFYGKR